MEKKEEEKGNKKERFPKIKARKVSVTKVTDTIDVDTGEVFKSVKTEVYGQTKEPPYIKMYLDDITRVKDLPSGMSKVLFELIKNMGYNNLLPLYMPIKKKMAENLDVSINYINKAINAFHKANIIIRIDRGLYMADPQLFARGEWKDIQNLRLVITYTADHQKILKSNLPEEIKEKLNLKQ